MPLRLLLPATLAAFAIVASAVAQEAPARRAPQAQTQTGADQQAAQPQRRLPADSVTKHTVTIAGRSLAFTATAGALVLTDDDGRPQIEMSFVAYTLDGADRRTRPVTFAMNGGPGSASAWLHLGLMGPWRLSLDAVAAQPSAPPELVPNAETWLDTTDLVFIDPAGTGFSRILSTDAEARRRIYSVDGDIETIATFIRRWLARENRLVSPKLFVGESYAGLRGPKLARVLQQSQGVGLNALILVSPILDYGWRASAGWQPLGWASVLPSMAATAREARGQITRADLADVETYAQGPFIADLMRGRQDRAAVGRIAERVAAFTGLDPALVQRMGGRVDRWTFQRERTRSEAVVASAYDASVTAADPYPDSFAGRFADPFTTALTAPVTSAMLDLYGERLKWRPAVRYFLSNGNVNSSWTYGQRSPPQAIDDLVQSLALDRSLDVIIAHGLTDLVTPYFESQLLIDQLPPFVTRERVRLLTYGGGHMFYSRDPSRVAFRRDVASLYERIAARWR